MMATFLSAAWTTTLELSPWLLLGMLVAGVLHVLVPQRWVHTHLRGPWAPLKAVLVGVPLPLCSCGVIPAGLGLKKDGASDGAALGFLISTPQTGVDSIFVSASFLGWPFALFKVATATITGVVGGWLTDALGQGSSAVEAAGGEAPEIISSGASKRSRPAWAEMLDHSMEVLRSIWRWLVFGVVASAAIETFLPTSWMQAVGELGSLGAALMTVLISIPLYVCATASVPIAAALVANGLPAGAALVFLMAGPATNVATLGAIFRGFGGRVVAIYLSTLIVGSVGFAMLFDWILPVAATAGAEPMDHASWWATAASLVLISLLLRFFVEDLLRGRVRRSQWQEAAESVEIPVGGLSCQSCVSKLEGALGSLQGVTGAEVSLESETATVYGSAEETELRRAIESAGFAAR